MAAKVIEVIVREKFHKKICLGSNDINDQFIPNWISNECYDGVVYSGIIFKAELRCILGLHSSGYKWQDEWMIITATTYIKIFLSNSKKSLL